MSIKDNGWVVVEVGVCVEWGWALWGVKADLEGVVSGIITKQLLNATLSSMDCTCVISGTNY